MCNYFLKKFRRTKANKSRKRSNHQNIEKERIDKDATFDSCESNLIKRKATRLRTRYFQDSGEGNTAKKTTRDIKVYKNSKIIRS